MFHLIKGLGRGGAEMLLSESYPFRGAGFEYAYGYFLPWKDHLVGSLTEQGAQVFCLHASSSPGVLLRGIALARLLRRWRADLVHCHLPVSGVAGRLAGLLARVPVVYTEHNLLEHYHPLTRCLNLATWGLQRQVVAVSPPVADSIARHTPSRVPVTVVRNGVSADRFRPAPRLGEQLRTQLGIPLAAPVVGTVAVFRAQKRLDLWLETASRVRQQFPEAHFLVVGHGPLEKELKQQANQLALPVHFPGIQADVRASLNALDVFLMTSDFEGLPVALLEAMASGLAVVATGVGGVPEAVRDGQTGLLTLPREVADSARKVGRLLADPHNRARLGAAARTLVETEFGLAPYARRLEQIYRERT